MIPQRCFDGRTASQTFTLGTGSRAQLFTYEHQSPEFACESPVQYVESRETRRPVLSVDLRRVRARRFYPCRESRAAHEVGLRPRRTSRPRPSMIIGAFE